MGVGVPVDVSWGGYGYEGTPVGRAHWCSGHRIPGNVGRRETNQVFHNRDEDCRHRPSVSRRVTDSHDEESRICTSRTDLKAPSPPLPRGAAIRRLESQPALFTLPAASRNLDASVDDIE